MYTISTLTIIVTALCISGTTANRYHPEWRGKGDGEGAQPLPAEATALYWRTEAAAALRQRLVERERRGRAKNVVLFLGDGMSVGTLMAARTLLGQRNHSTGEEARLSFETFPTVGLVKVRTSALHYYRHYSVYNNVHSLSLVLFVHSKILFTNKCSMDNGRHIYNLRL